MKLPWYIRQKPAVTLVLGLGGLYTVVNVAGAQPWATTTAPSSFPPNLNWAALASSADGARLVAAGGSIITGRYMSSLPAPIYVSIDAGATWAQTSAPSNYWSSVASSADGIRLVAASPFFLDHPPFGGDGLIYTSPDAGITWTPTSAPSNTWSSVASSADGTRLLAVAALPWQWWDATNGAYVGDGAIYRSHDTGVTWIATSAPSNNWTAVRSSADGTKLLALSALEWDSDLNHYLGEGSIYRSLDSGATWSRTGAPSNDWSGVACSADGTKWVAVSVGRYEPSRCEFVGGGVYSSLDSGATWNQVGACSNGCGAVASSADGTKWVTDGGISTNAGATWTASRGPAAGATAVACSADGYRAVAGGNRTSLYRLPYTGPWRLADAPDEGWESVASSADGTKIVAVAWWSGPICISTNSGATWSRTSARNNSWYRVASSADGTKLVATAAPTDGGDGLIYTSSNSGTTWMATTAPRDFWSSVASSADGARLVAVASLVQGYPQYGDGLIYTSCDSGRSWTRTSAPTNCWATVTSSADGVKLVAGTEPTDGGNGGLIYISRDSGATWTPTSAPSNYWWSIASSVDGTKLVAAWGLDASGNSGRIYTSSDSGATWTPTSAPTQEWWSVATSADGTRLVAVAVQPTSIYNSTNSGATWAPMNAPAAGWWYGITSSADGNRLVAISGDGLVYTLQSPAPPPPPPPAPQLAIAGSAGNVSLSWLVPSTRFVLQQSSDLGSLNWVNAPTSPALDFTNLHYRVSLMPSSSGSYYRLKQQ